MYFDDAVVAGLLVVVGTCVFLGGFVYFVYQDSHKKKGKE